MNDDKGFSEETLQEIVRRIVETAQPERIILFGSAARGEMGSHSDVDLLVIKRGEFHSPKSWLSWRPGASSVDNESGAAKARPFTTRRAKWQRSRSAR